MPITASTGSPANRLATPLRNAGHIVGFRKRKGFREGMTCAALGRCLFWARDVTVATRDTRCLPSEIRLVSPRPTSRIVACRIKKEIIVGGTVGCQVKCNYDCIQWMDCDIFTEAGCIARDTFA